MDHMVFNHLFLNVFFSQLNFLGYLVVLTDTVPGVKLFIPSIYQQLCFNGMQVDLQIEEPKGTGLKGPIQAYR